MHDRPSFFSRSPLFSDFRHPLVLGHRGMPKEHQENTLSGFKKAVELGIDGIELDVILSRDNQLVVFHDDDLERMTGCHGEIANMPWEQISELEIKQLIDVGDKSINYDKKEKICLLSDVLEEVKGQLVVNIELKGCKADTGSEVAKILEKMNLLSSVFVTSFHRRPLRALYQQNKNISCGFAIDKGTGYLDKLRQGFHNSGFSRNLVGSALTCMNIDMISKESIDTQHRRGLYVGAWTLFADDSQYFELLNNEAAQKEKAQQLKEWKVDFIITDDPLKLKNLLQ